MATNDGGPAYPGWMPTGGITEHAIPDSRQVEEIPNGVHFPGMSLRDYFAAKATEKDIAYWWEETALPITRVAARYAHADAMLAEREKEPNR